MLAPDPARSFAFAGNLRTAGRLKDGSETLGFVINYTPDEALRCDLEGQPLEVLAKAYRPGEIKIRIGGRPVPPGLVATCYARRSKKRVVIWRGS